VTGVYCWRSSDYDNGPQYLMEAINLSPGFSKPHYILGNIYFEHATVSQLPEFFAPAEEQYRKSLAIFPEDPYAWFSLGHVLKKTNRLQER
jgi:tetratricopeptide (TPR) repeat protein